MAYTKGNDPWEDLPSTDTPISAEKLDNFETGIADAHTLIAAETSARAAADTAHAADTTSVHGIADTSVLETTTGAQAKADAAETAAGAYTDAEIAALPALAHQAAITVPTDIDATGTPSATTFLRGDGAWATPAGGGSGVVETVAAGTGIDVDATDPANPSVSIEAGVYRSGGTDVAVADGGTGASTAANARTNLGLVIGTDVQAHSAVLDATTASFTTADETKLDGIEALADVTDATNVAAAGAVMGNGSILNIVALTQATYDGLTPVATTLYIITDAA